MREIKIEDEVIMDATTEEALECPVNDRDCRTRCAWYHEERFDGNTQVAHCKDHCIGKIVK